jgi:Rrf2 family protein
LLSQRCRYALKAMLHLARDSEATRQVSAIATEENIPKKFLEAIMADMRRAGLADATRGKHGGYRLSRPADLITIGEIVRAVDGPLALLPCVSRNFYRRCADCPDEAACDLRRVMAQVRKQATDILDHVSLADAVAGHAETPET